MGWPRCLAGNFKGRWRRRSAQAGLDFSAGRGVPEEGVAMYGGKVEFVVEGLGLATMTPEGYDSVVDRIGPAGPGSWQHAEPRPSS